MIIFNRKVESLAGRLSGVWRCVIGFNDDTAFLVDTWFDYDENKVMDRAKLKRKIERALYDR